MRRSVALHQVSLSMEIADERAANSKSAFHRNSQPQ
jgi:hypothetical protein